MPFVNTFSFNEELNLPIFYERATSVLRRLSSLYEIIIVDDGSKDNTFKVLKDIAANDSRLKVISFRGNFGQTAALSAGIEVAQGEFIILIDIDLENDPEDIKIIIDKLKEGYDVVSGWRKLRWEGQFFTRKIPSLAANSLISKVTGVKLNDFGCTLKGYRRESIKHIHLYGEMHRFIPAYAKKQGWKPRARILAMANVGDSPTLMLNAPVPAAKKVLAKAGLTLNDIDLFEINEAFAVVAEKFIRDLKLDRNKVNVNGGAMALGHPIGATGSLLIGTILDELERRDLKRGLVTMCAAGGMAPAIIIERI